METYFDICNIFFALFLIVRLKICGIE